MLCGQCKWWRPVVERHFRIREHDKKWLMLGECRHPKWFYGYGYSAGDIPLDGIWVEDDEGWGCYTGKNFGCIHWEK